MLTRIETHNFKALQTSDFHLGKITLLTGANAVGKSTLLQALLLLRQSYNNGEITGLRLKGKYLHLGLGKDVVSINADKGDFVQFALTINYEKELIYSFGQNPDKDILPLREKSQDLQPETIALFAGGKQFQYLSASRISPDIQYKTSPQIVDELHELGKEGEYTVHYLASHQNTPIANPALQHPHAKSDTLLDNVSAWLSEITEDVRINAVYHEDLETATLTYGFLTSGIYTDFKPINVGFGLTYVLPIIVAALMLNKDGLLIVENPESHLHPKGQSRLVKLCCQAAASGIQVILETHSDHILNGLRVAIRRRESILAEDAMIYFFSRNSDSETLEPEITAVHIDENGRASTWPKGFFDEWDMQLNLLLE